MIVEYLAEVRRSLGDATGRERLLEELGAHLDDAAARHRAGGLSSAAAAAHAVQECGTASAVADAVAANDERKAYLMAMTRWTGVAGLAAVVSGVAGMMVYSWVSFMVTVALAAVAVIGLLVAHWPVARTHISVGVVALVAGLAVASGNPVGSAHPLYTVGIPGALTLVALTLAVVAFLRGGVVPRPAALLLLAGLAVAIGVNVAGYLTPSDPAYLGNAGGIAALAGWVWTNAALVAKGFHRQSVAPV